MAVMIWLAAIWGFAEATFFFLVPDVILTWIALRHGWRQAGWASLAACSGALIGGGLMYHWGAVDAQQAYAFLDAIPAISQPILLPRDHPRVAQARKVRTSGMVTAAQTT
jgi:hypothetical protein